MAPSPARVRRSSDGAETRRVFPGGHCWSVDGRGEHVRGSGCHGRLGELEAGWP